MEPLPSSSSYKNPSLAMTREPYVDIVFIYTSLFTYTHTCTLDWHASLHTSSMLEGAPPSSPSLQRCQNSLFISPNGCAFLSLCHSSWCLWPFSCMVDHTHMLLLRMDFQHPLSSLSSCTCPLSQVSQALMESLKRTHLHCMKSHHLLT